MKDRSKRSAWHWRINGHSSLSAPSSCRYELYDITYSRYCPLRFMAEPIVGILRVFNAVFSNNRRISWVSII